MNKKLNTGESYLISFMDYGEVKELLELSEECVRVYAEVEVLYEGEIYDLERLYDMISDCLVSNDPDCVEFLRLLLRKFEANLPEDMGIGGNGVRVYRLYTLLAVIESVFLEERL